jgi:hypothetical protein
MKKIIRLTESDLTNIVKRVIKENSAKDSIIEVIKGEGWKSAADLVGGDKNLIKLAFNNDPIDFLHMFDDLDVVQSKEKPDWTLFRFKPKHNLMVYNSRVNMVYLNNIDILSVLVRHFGLNKREVNKLTQKWLSEIDNLKGAEIGVLNSHWPVVLV